MIINEIVKDVETVIAVDIAKNSFQVFVCNQKTGKQKNQKVSRDNFVNHIIKLGTGVIFMESCGSSQYWARLFEKHGYVVKLIAAQHVKAFLKNKRVKNDMKDAEAIYKCGIQPDTKYVKVKSEEEQTVALLHTFRQACIKTRIEISNRIRSILSEFGIIVAKGKSKVDTELKMLFEAAENITNLDLKATIEELFEDYKNEKSKEAKISDRINKLSQENQLVEIAKTCPGVGDMTASALVAEVGNAQHFKNGREMAAWVGLVPSQHSTGGRSTLGGITKTGNTYIRKLLSQCALSVIRRAGIRKENGTDNQIDRFVLRLELQNKPQKKIMIAVANKIIRILWVLLSTRTEFENQTI